LGKFGVKAEFVHNSTEAMKNYQAKNPEIRFFTMTTSLYNGYVAVDIKSGRVLDFFRSELFSVLRSPYEQKEMAEIE